MDFLMSAHHQGPDSLSLQEMLDIDEFKTENDFENVFKCGDLSLNFSELPALNLDEDSLGAPGDNNVWLTSSDSQSLLGGDLNSSLSLDMTRDETRMVCPNTVMPVTLIQIPYLVDDESEPKGKITKRFIEDQGNNVGFQKLNFETFTCNKTTNTNQNSILNRFAIKENIKEEEIDIDEESWILNGGGLMSAFEFTEDTIKKEEPQFHFINVNKLTSTSNKGKIKVSQLSNTIPIAQKANSVVNRHLYTMANSNGKKQTNGIRTMNAKKRLNDQYNRREDLIVVYPKPAYSYSCLIAMALKNSPSGSLPVSEIYNFMCEHFPYFKTAPSGWKNSVRHNLSLNKCFEKIEKPATNGSQRKGCLWAMNPTKVGKMDEEVQKWSKKDKLGIRKSMVCPDSLDALERGELAGIGASYNHNPGSIETVHSEIESEEGGNDWENFKRGEQTDDEEDDDEDEDDEDEDIDQHLGTRFVEDRDFDESDLSLSDFDIEVTESVLKEWEGDKLKPRLSPNTSPYKALTGFELSGGTTYTFNSNGESPKRIKTLGGSTITGNYVYKPIGTISKRKSPLRPTLLSSLEVETDD